MATSLFQPGTSEPRKFPIEIIALTLAMIVLIVLGLAYFGRAPYGSKIDLPPDLEVAIKEHFLKKENRTIKQMTVFSCSEFLDSFKTRGKKFAAVVELGDWKPGVDVDETKWLIGTLLNNVSIASAATDEDSVWQISSLTIPGADYQRAIEPKSSDLHPCQIKPRIRTS